MGAENIALHFDVCNHTAGTCNFPTTTISIDATTPSVGSTSEKVPPFVIGIIVLGGIAGLVVGILCCWKCRKQKYDQMVSRTRDLGLQNILFFCCVIFIEIGLDIPQN